MECSIFDMNTTTRKERILLLFSTQVTPLIGSPNINHQQMTELQQIIRAAIDRDQPLL